MFHIHAKSLHAVERPRFLPCLFVCPNIGKLENVINDISKALIIWPTNSRRRIFYSPEPLRLECCRLSIQIFLTALCAIDRLLGLQRGLIHKTDHFVLIEDSKMITLYNCSHVLERIVQLESNISCYKMWISNRLIMPLEFHYE